MRRHLAVADLARDRRFVRVPLEERFKDPRPAFGGGGGAYGAGAGEDTGRPSGRRLTPDAPNAPDSARTLMHGIFVGEIQALEGAGRTCYDFDTGEGPEEVPFAMKLDMARQCWDEARHVEISVKLTEHMGSEVGEFSEQTFLFEAACNADPVLRLTGVNRALEGLAIDVFNTMREYGNTVSDPVLYFCEDWMLADEVTHVKMGSDWLRRITAKDKERQQRALEFQRTVDKLFSLGGFRGESDESPVHLARKFRSMAGFSDDEIVELVDVAAEALRDAEAMMSAASGETPAA
ncbi:MAG TPA: DUF455 family protein [Acidimicrobiales bacterium]|nr:DUF455 family protein [Acidimicrobiales bacterium]